MYYQHQSGSGLPTNIGRSHQMVYDTENVLGSLMQSMNWAVHMLKEIPYMVRCGQSRDDILRCNGIKTGLMNQSMEVGHRILYSIIALLADIKRIVGHFPAGP